MLMVGNPSTAPVETPKWAKPIVTQALKHQRSLEVPARAAPVSGSPVVGPLPSRRLSGRRLACPLSSA